MCVHKMKWKLNGKKLSIHSPAQQATKIKRNIRRNDFGLVFKQKLPNHHYTVLGKFGRQYWTLGGICFKLSSHLNLHWNALVSDSTDIALIFHTKYIASAYWTFGSASGKRGKFLFCKLWTIVGNRWGVSIATTILFLNLLCSFITFSF